MLEQSLPILILLLPLLLEAGHLMSMLTFGQRKTCVLPDAHLRLHHNLALGSCGSSLIEYFGSLLMMRLMLCALFICNIGDKIRRLNMNVAFENICKKG